MKSNGVPTPSGKSCKWTKNTVYSILTNEKYKGDALLQKKYTADYLEYRMVTNNGELPQYYVEKNHHAIIKREVREMVQTEMVRRSILENKDVELKGLIDALDSSYKQADEALQNAINKVQTNLDKAVTDLNETISNNKDDIESKLNAAVKAYEDANVIINSKFASIAIKHEEFANLFDSLKEDLKTTEEKIWKEINDLQDDLKKLKEEMNKKDNELEEMIKSLTENTEKDKNYLDTISYINLGLIVALAVVVIIIVLFFKRKMKNY